MKIGAKLKKLNLELQHHTMRSDQAVRYFITCYAIALLLPCWNSRQNAVHKAYVSLSDEDMDASPGCMPGHSDYFLIRGMLPAVQPDKIWLEEQPYQS